MKLSRAAMLRAIHVASEYPKGCAEFWGQDKEGHWVSDLGMVEPGKG